MHLQIAFQKYHYILTTTHIGSISSSFLLLIIGAHSESNNVQKYVGHRRTAIDIVLWLLGVTSSSGFPDIRSLLP